jgi:hypothetical protein
VHIKKSDDLRKLCAKKSNYTSHFGTIIGNANHLNVGRQARLAAGAMDERTLAAVACTPQYRPWNYTN